MTVNQLLDMSKFSLPSVIFESYKSTQGLRKVGIMKSLQTLDSDLLGSCFSSLASSRQPKIRSSVASHYSVLGALVALQNTRVLYFALRGKSFLLLKSGTSTIHQGHRSASAGIEDGRRRLLSAV